MLNESIKLGIDGEIIMVYYILLVEKKFEFLVRYIYVDDEDVVSVVE